MLDREELNVQEIVDIIGGAQSGISRHLSVLKNSGFIKDRKEGTWSYYSSVQEDHGFKKDMLDKLAEELKSDNDFKHDIEKLSQVIEKRKDIAREFFKGSALNIDSLTGVYDDERLRLLSLLKLIPVKLNVIDLGCGKGSFLPFLASIKANIAAVDASEPLLKQARDLMNDYDNISFYLSDVSNSEIKDNWADACFVNMVMHHMPKPKDFFSSVKKVIKPGGLLIISDFVSHGDETMRENFGDLWLGFEQSEIKNWALNSGFHDIDIQMLNTNGKQVFIFSATKK